MSTLDFDSVSDRKHNGRAPFLAIVRPSRDGTIGAYRLTPEERLRVMEENQRNGLAHLVEERNGMRVYSRRMLTSRKKSEPRRS